MTNLRKLTQWPGGLWMVMVLVLVQACTRGATREFLGPDPGTTSPALVRLSVVPRSAQLVLGDSVRLVAYGQFLNGDSAVAPVTWSSRIGAISDAGWYRAVQEGADTIRAVSKAQPALSDAATLDVMNPLDLAIVRLTPQAATLPSGNSIQFIARTTLPDGSEIAPEVTWSSTGAAISPAGLFFALGQPGTYQVTARIKGRTRSGSASVSVLPASLDVLLLNPSIALLTAGKVRQFTVAALWSDGSITLPPLTWSATGGTISPSGLYTAGATPGTFRVVATHQGGTRADTSTVTISVPAPTLTQLTVSPKSLALTTGGVQQYGVSATWSDGSTAVPAVTWSATGGTITSNGLFSAGTAPGAFRVIATQQGGTKADTATVTISIPVATLVTLVLNPHAFTIQPGATQQFTVAGGWSDGSSATPAVTYVATGGSITPTGLYTAGTTPGSFRVIATQQGGTRADTATVTINPLPPTLSTLVLTPGSVSLASGATQQFSVAGSWSDGTSTTPLVSYAATGGTITVTGMYTAGSTAGTFRVIATQQGGNRADTSSVIVAALPPTLTSLTISPRSVTVAPNGTQQFTVSGIWSNGTTAMPAVAYAATGGTIGSRGLYTAGATPGSFEVIGAQAGGGRSDTSTVVVSAPTLRMLAAARGFQMGAAVDIGAYRTDPQYYRVLTTQYNSLVPENATEWKWIHPGPGQYAFADADLLVADAQARGMSVHAHTLDVTLLPSWVTGGNLTKAQALAVLKDHIETVVGRYRGRIAGWDVVNEIIAADGVTLRNTFWIQVIGPEYIDSAFVWTKRADPTAKLYINENSAEGNWWTKQTTILALAQALRNRGIPIDGIGFQSHLTIANAPSANNINANFTRFTNAGFDIRVSEMDVRTADGVGVSELQAQATIYRDVLDACLRQPRCVGFTTWGFTDRISWIPAWYPGFGRALPFDLNYQAKPAFDSLMARLRRP